ncbi:hypothetical protein RYZ26_01720 [Terasakiella sp. A23]|uniref:hypothetical protein n=1 Tax=Terasakiella sp. FCG-A23 TaxID=3080561 RepID=UPI002954710E|nr:hypothetical protein [Terasakiella sp. A23]MDV7338295.1 hypothetical protein [Terasakiella sp. A23]
MALNRAGLHVPRLTKVYDGLYANLADSRTIAAFVLKMNGFFFVSLGETVHNDAGFTKSRVQ